MSEFLAMGGYGAYVWSAFGVSLGLLVGLFVLSWRLSRRREAELERWRHQARRRPQAPPSGVLEPLSRAAD